MLILTAVNVLVAQSGGTPGIWISSAIFWAVFIYSFFSTIIFMANLLDSDSGKAEATSLLDLADIASFGILTTAGVAFTLWSTDSTVGKDTCFGNIDPTESFYFVWLQLAFTSLSVWATAGFTPIVAKCSLALILAGYTIIQGIAIRLIAVPWVLGILLGKFRTTLLPRHLPLRRGRMAITYAHASGPRKNAFGAARI